KALQGDTAPLEAMFKSYKETGLLPALAQGDIDQAVTALKEHPVFSALEASGALAGLDRAAGALVKKPAREALELAGDQGAIPRSYSDGLVKRSIQRRSDRKRDAEQGGQRATGRETERYL